MVFIRDLNFFTDSNKKKIATVHAVLKVFLKTVQRKKSF